jgi:hypothetical protein
MAPTQMIHAPQPNWLRSHTASRMQHMGGETTEILNCVSQTKRGRSFMPSLLRGAAAKLPIHYTPISSAFQGHFAIISKIPGKGHYIKYLRNRSFQSAQNIVN